MVGVSASVNLSLHHKVQKFASGTGSPGWSRKRAVKRLWWLLYILTCASALPGKTGKSKNHIFTQLDCVIHTMHLCAVFLKEKVVICDVFDSI